MSDPSETDAARRLRALEERIARAKGATGPRPHLEEHYSQAQLAWRMVLEMVSGLGIGFVMGYGLDYWLGTMPVFLVVFTLLGLAAGVKTMLRSAAEVQRKTDAKGAAAPRATEGEGG